MAAPLAAIGLLAFAAACASDHTCPTGPCQGVQPPELTCPANLTVTGASAIGEAVSYAVPAPIGGTPPVSTTCVPATGTVFPTGATTVGCTARDGINRTAVCAFTVTLKSSSLSAMHFLAFGDSTTAGENGEDFDGDMFPENYPPPTCGTSSLQSAARALATGQTSPRPQFFDPSTSYPQQLLNLLKVRFPGQSFVMENEGHPSEQAVGLDSGSGQGRLADCFATGDRPDVMLLLEGINDIASSATPWAPTLKERQAIFGALNSDVLKAASSGVSFILVSTILPVGNCRTFDPPQPCRGADPAVFGELLAKNAAVDQVNALIRAGIGGATIVDGNAAFKAADPTLVSLIDVDGLHPTKAGYGVLANAWMNAITNKIPITSLRRAR